MRCKLLSASVGRSKVKSTGPWSSLIIYEIINVQYKRGRSVLL